MTHDGSDSVLRSELKNDNLISGKLFFGKDSNVSVKNVDIHLVGIPNVIATITPELVDGGAKFEFKIDSRARAGEYTVTWNILISGKESTIINQFVISSDVIDRTIPVELVHLS